MRPLIPTWLSTFKITVAAPELLRTIALLGLFLAVVGLVFQGVFWLVALTGLKLTLLSKITLWYAMGLGGAIFWPWTYRKNRTKGDWTSFLKGLLLVATSGPLAIVFVFLL